LPSLAGLPFKIWGTEWPECRPFDRLVQERGRRLTPEEYVKIFNATDININLHSSTEKDGVDPNGDFVNPRTFELASAGAFQLVDERLLLPEAFEAGKELVTFRNTADLKDKIAYYMQRPEERRQIALAGQKRAINEHTYVHRLRDILSSIYSSRYEQLRRRDDGGGWNRLLKRAKPHEELSKRCNDSFVRGEEATLDGLVADIVTGEGKLTETEMKLLFLHHVRSQIIRMTIEEAGGDTLMKKRFPNKKNILLVNITRLGDMLQATPTIAGMRQENPGCRVTVVVEKQFESICKIIPGIDEVISLDLGMTVRSLAREQEGIVDAYEYFSEFVEDLRKRKFDYCLNMSSSAYTAMLLRLLDIKANGGWTADEEGHRIIESDWARLFASSVFHQNRQYNALNLVDVFRCSADVEQHPNHLLLDVPEAEQAYAREMLTSADFANHGPLIAIQAGASQNKRQWAPRNFIQFINILTGTHAARVVLTGTKKELPIIEEIYRGCDPHNVLIAASRTNVPQLAALLKACDILITGDTGPMHIAAAVGTPSIAMFLASAFGFETGPYSEGNIVLQPVIGCGPCNPNKPCARPDCHDCIAPQLWPS
jgi:ADP-heptose:LPS heptosyltransferase